MTDYAIEGDNTKIACSYKNLCSSVKKGSLIYIADGSLTCEVTDVLDVSTFRVLIFFIRTTLSLSLKMP